MKEGADITKEATKLLEFKLIDKFSSPHQTHNKSIHAGPHINGVSVETHPVCKHCNRVQVVNRAYPDPILSKQKELVLRL